MMGGACEDWGSGAIGGKITARLATKEVVCSRTPPPGAVARADESMPGLGLLQPAYGF